MGIPTCCTADTVWDTGATEATTSTAGGLLRLSPRPRPTPTCCTADTDTDMVSDTDTDMVSSYFPFEKAIEMWGRCYAAMGISYEGATMTLDLLDEAAVTPANIQALADQIEERVQGGLGARPMLSVPHIISDEA